MNHPTREAAQTAPADLAGSGRLHAPLAFARRAEPADFAETAGHTQPHVHTEEAADDEVDRAVWRHAAFALVVALSCAAWASGVFG